MTGLVQALQEVELLVGTITGTEPHAGARAPSTVLRLDLGGRGEREAAVEGEHDGRKLTGSQVICAVRGDDLLVLGARSHAHGLVLLRPGREVEPGSPVG